MVPFFCRVTPSVRHCRVTRCPGPHETAHKAASIAIALISAGSLVRWMAHRKVPKTHLATALSQFVGVGIAEMPPSGQSGVIGHGLQKQNSFALLSQKGQTIRAPLHRQMVKYGLPLMVPHPWMHPRQRRQTW